MAKGVWIEGYGQCGCTSEAARKADLVGYCQKHGSDRTSRYFVPNKCLTPEQRKAGHIADNAATPGGTEP